MTDWAYNDIPISKYKVVTEPNPVTGEIKQITDIAGKVQTEIIQTKSEQIRNALIDLGWTPPEGKEHVPESKLAQYIDVERLLIAAYECKFYGFRITELSWHDLLACTAYLFAHPPHIRKHERTTPPEADTAGL